MPDAGDKPEQPERTDPPEYTVYKSRPRLSRPDPQAGPLRPRRPVQARRRRRRQAAEGVPGRRTTAPGGARRSSGPGSSPSAGSRSASSPSRSRRRSRRAKLADGVGNVLDGNPFMLVSPQTILVLGTDVRSGAFAGARRGRVEELHRRRHQRPPDRRQLQERPLPLGHDHADPRRRRHLPQALDPPRHARRGPRPGPAEDQLRLRLRRRQARRAHGRGPARDRRRPGRDHRLRRLPQLHRHDRRDRRRPADRRLLERLRAAPSTSTSSRARTTSTASRRSPWREPARTAAARASSPAPTSSGPSSSS